MEEESGKSNPHKDISDKDVEEWYKKKFTEECGKDGKFKHGKKDKEYKTGAGTGDDLYFLGLIGAVVYYIGASSSFWDGVLGILKAIVWPAFLVHGLLGLIG